MAGKKIGEGAIKRYQKSENGKGRYARANAKSKGKKFILEYATLEELEEWKGFIADREKELQNK